MTSLRIAIASGLVAICLVIIAVIKAGEAHAWPWSCPYAVTWVDSGFGGFCDSAPVITGQHYHCEWGGFLVYGGTCSWRWGDNTNAPPP